MIARPEHGKRRQFRRSVVALVGAASALVPALLTNSAAPAQAAPVRAAIGSVTVSPQNPRFDRPVTISVSWCVPDGTKSGDTFHLVVPPQLTPLTNGFGLRDSAGDLVASATVANNVVSVTTSTFVASHSNVCSEMRFPAAIVLDQVRVNTTNTIVFRVGAASYPVKIKPVETAGASPNQAIMYGAWAHPADQGRTDTIGALLWYFESPRAPAGGVQTVTFTDLPTPGQTAECASIRVEVGTLDRFNHFIYTGRYSGTVHAACSVDRAAVAIGPLAAGMVARAVVPTTVSSTKTSFEHTGTVAVDGTPPVRVGAEPVRRYAAAGTASGRVLAPGAATTGGSDGKATKSGLSGAGVGLLIGGVALALIIIAGAVLVPRRRRRDDEDASAADATATTGGVTEEPGDTSGHA